MMSISATLGGLGGLHKIPWPIARLGVRTISILEEGYTPKDTIKARTQQGDVLGRVSRLGNGRHMFSFQGIPYAAAPKGSLRFKAPRPRQGWEGVLDATSAGPCCPQKNPNNGQVTGDEDCLSVNIYTTNLPQPDTEPRTTQPIMVWIHGGGLRSGSAGDALYGPDYLAARDVVVVTVNYRLGPLGFLCLHNEEAQGNAGGKDIVAALRWIRANAAYFGGDAGCVTVFGEGTGAALIHGLMMAPAARGLFHRAILQSGSLLGDWGIEPKPRERASALARQLGCDDRSASGQAEFLKRTPAADIVEAADELIAPSERRRGYAMPFCLSVEGLGSTLPTEEMFLPDTPKALFEAGRVAKLPMMIGYNEHEGMAFLPEYIRSLKEVDRDFESLVPLGLRLHDKSPRSLAVARKMREFYFGEMRVDKDSLPQLIDLLSDVHVVRGMHETLHAHASMIQSLYFYKFSFVGKINYYKNILRINRRGCSHGDEMFYLFKPGSFDVTVDHDSHEYRTRERMVTLWTNFSKYGNPTPNKDGVIVTEKWRPVRGQSLNYMEITSEMRMRQNPNPDRLRFWNDLHAMLHNDSVM